MTKYGAPDLAETEFLSIDELIPHPVGELAELSNAVVIDSAIVAKAVAEELRRVDGWIKLTNFADVLSALWRVDRESAEKLSACSDPDCGFIKFCPSGDYTQYCNRRCWLRICPNCAKSIAARLRAKLEAVLVEVQKQGAGWPLKHLTLTIKRSPVDVEGLDYEAELMARADASRRDIEEFHDMEKALIKTIWTKEDKRAGASAYLEFGPAGGNIHSHTIAYVPFVSQAAISEAWLGLSLFTRRIWGPWVEDQRALLAERKAHLLAELRALGKSRCLRARRLRLVLARMGKRWTEAEICRRAKRQGVGDYIVDIRKIDAERALGEVVKYVTKLHKRDKWSGEFETPVYDLVALHLALKGKRRAWSWGSFYGVDVVEEDEAESDPFTCPKCGAVLLGMPVKDARAAVLHLKDEINCIGRSDSGAPVASGPPVSPT